MAVLSALLPNLTLNSDIGNGDKNPPTSGGIDLNRLGPLFRPGHLCQAEWTIGNYAEYPRQQKRKQDEDQF